MVERMEKGGYKKELKVLFHGISGICGEKVRPETTKEELKKMFAEYVDKKVKEYRDSFVMMFDVNEFKDGIQTGRERHGMEDWDAVRQELMRETGVRKVERLTERDLGFAQIKECGNNFCKETCVEHDKSCENCPIQKAIEKLTQYEDLEEQGKMLKLPCSVGDIMFWRHGTEILPVKIEYFMVFSTEIKIAIQYCGDEETLKHFSTVVFDKDIGKTVFFTEEEAAGGRMP